MVCGGRLRVGCAACCIGSLGGGLLGGDVARVEIAALAGATLYVGTQASLKVYKKRRLGSVQELGATAQQLSARVEPGALLVWAPDATVPFEDALFRAEDLCGGL